MNCETPVCWHHRIQNRAFLKLETLRSAISWRCVNINYVNVLCKTIKPYNTKHGSVIACDANQLTRSRAPRPSNRYTKCGLACFQVVRINWKPQPTQQTFSKYEAKNIYD